MMRKIISLYLVLLFPSFSYASVSAEDLYLKNCMVCHAEDGSGTMPGVSDLQENLQWSKIEESKLLTRLKLGIQKTGVSMPAKGGNPNLTDDDLLEIIRYMLKTFTK